MANKTVQKTSATDKKIVAETITAILSSPNLVKASELLGISDRQIYNRMENYPEIRAAIDEVPKRALEILKNGSIKAATTLVEAMDERMNKMEAAKEVLDRVGLTKGPQTQVNIQNNNLSGIEFVMDGE